jgi:molybdate transport system ATP-binding protein
VFVQPERRSVGYLFQDYLLFPHLSAVENVAFGLRSRRLADPRGIAVEWLRRVGLSELEQARPAQLSGGQAQRVALARALAPQPRMLLLDEPLAALDASTRVVVRRLLKRHLAEFRGVRLLVTHDALEAAALADRVVVLEAGRVAQEGSLADITARPRSRYVADLAGVNLWRGSARDGRVEVEGGVVWAASGLEGDVYVLLQPRAVALYTERPLGSPRNVWQGRAASLEPVGERVRVLVEGPLPVVAEITPGALSELGFATGDALWVSFKASEVEVYEA